MNYEFTRSALLRLAVAVAALGCASLLASAQDSAGEATDLAATELAAIGQRYRARCATCHTAPDVRFETDRAWLGRIPETT